VASGCSRAAFAAMVSSSVSGNRCQSPDLDSAVVDRLTCSLADFAKLVELFDGHGVSFMSPKERE
jgi:DNA invertase Pin-like site-specific DNA recombinase